jgi:hypothetical protein
MKLFTPNVGTTDRIIRIIIGATAIVAGYFWLSGFSQILAYVAGVITLLTGMIAFCGLYTICNTSTCQVKPAKISTGKSTALLFVLFIVIFGIESFASTVITRKKFLEDFNHMNGFYKQTLFLTGQSNRSEAIKQYDLLVVAYTDFREKYSAYKPYVIKHDVAFDQDIEKISNIISSIKDGVYTGDLPMTHKKLEEIRPIFQEMFKRNGFSMESMALVDFHDVMETLIAAADAKNTQEVLSVYSQASDLLKIVENADSSDGVKRIRIALDVLKKDAESNNNDKLSSDAAELKKQFIAVYLLKG